MKQTIFKIKHKLTGKFSTGGTLPRWTTNGKTWSRRSDVVTSITNAFENLKSMILAFRKRGEYGSAEYFEQKAKETEQLLKDAEENWILVEYEVTEKSLTDARSAVRR